MNYMKNEKCDSVVDLNPMIYNDTQEYRQMDSSKSLIS